MDKYHLHEKLASYCMLTKTQSVCCVSLFLKYIIDRDLDLFILIYSCSLYAGYLNTYKSSFNKYTASYGFICVELFKITF